MEPSRRCDMRIHRLVYGLLAGLMLLGLTVPAAEGQNDVPTLQLMEIVSGAIDDDTSEARWQFEASAGDRVSVTVWTVSGDLDPYVQIIDESGRVLAENDDIAYPDRLDAALEAVEIPREGMYTVRVTRFGFEEGHTQGEFSLVLLPAFADPIFWEPFDGARTWTADSTDLMDVQGVDGQLELSVNATNTLAYAATDDAPGVPLRAYVQVDVTVENEPDYWEYGLVFRQIDSADYYLFSVSSRGDWAFLGRTGASTWLHFQDWTAHPALEEPPRHATLGVLMEGERFTFYINGTVLSTLVANTIDVPGTIALSAGTVDQQDVLPVIRYDNLLVTAPLPAVVDEEEMGGQPLTTWESRDATPIVEELTAQGVIPEAASQTMYVPESFVTVSRQGMQTLALGQGRTQTDFVMGSSIILESDSAENGCGLIFRRASADQYALFFVDGLGGYGLSEWTLDRFDPAVYEMTRPPSGETNLDRVVLVAQEDRVRVYINGEPVTVRPALPVEGGVAIVALSFDGAFVNCRFEDTWLWTWE